MPARIQFVANRRMKVSNLEEVGQMRRRRGISMKMMMNELALQVISFKGCDQAGTTYRHRAPKRIRRLTWNRCDMPKAKQRKMHITPVLHQM